VDFFGFDKVLFASDVPFEPSPGLYIRETIRILDAMDITKEQREQIYRGNALKFLKPAKASQTA
jgi:uncharacterized protein